MPKVQYINEGFTSGEISQELQGRVSSDTYKESVHVMENMVATVQGAAIRRPGSKFVAEASQTNSDSGHRLIPYKISASRGVMFHAGPAVLTAYDQAGLVVASGVGVGVIVSANPYFHSQLDGWVERNFSNNISPPNLYYNAYGADVSWDALRPSAQFDVASAGGGLFFWSSARAGLVQAVTLNPNTQYELAFTSSSPTVPASPGTPEPVPGYVRVVTVTNPDNFFPATSGYVTATLASLPYTINAQSGTVQFTTPNWGVPTKVHLEITGALQGTSSGGPHPFVVHGWLSNMTTCKLTKTGAAAGIVSFTSPWIGKNIAELSFIQTPESPSKLILAHPDVATQQITYDPSTDAWSLSPVAFVSPPWAVGEFPGTVGVHSGRLVFASSRARPERVWFSKSLDYFNFLAGSGTADAFFGDLSEPGRVLWIRSMWSLVLGAESGLWDISAFSGVVLGPGNAKVFKHQTHRSSNSAPAFINNEVAYIGEGSKRMYSVHRERYDNNYVDKELSFTARHAAASGFRDIAWAEFPQNTLWSSVSEIGLGTLMAATYDSQLLKMAGWHRHSVGGAVVAVGAVAVGGVDQVFLLVGRIKGTTAYLSVERLDWSTYLDSSIVRTFPAATTVITGLGHLEGQSVYALDAVGIVHGPFTVASATITLEDAVSSVIVGLPFRSKIVTNRPEGLLPSGTAQGLKKRWNKIFVRLAPGARPLINGSRPPDRDPLTPMNYGQGPAYEDVEVSSLGWSKDGSITVEEFLPVPLTVAAIFGHVTAEVL